MLSKGERFSLIEQPNMPRQPSSPNRKLIAAAGMVGGIGAGLGFIVLMEMLNHSIRRPVDLTAKLGIEPFATVPYIRTPGEVRRKRSLIVAALVLIAVAIPARLFAMQRLLPAARPPDPSEVLAKVGIASDAEDSRPRALSPAGD